MSSEWSSRSIDTRYNGYRFRSRTEARWALFFDKIGIQYRYELEGFELDDGRYLPDFYLSNVAARTTDSDDGLWIEIKPVRGKGPVDKSTGPRLESNKDASSDLYNLVEITGEPAALLSGEVTASRHYHRQSSVGSKEGFVLFEPPTAYNSTSYDWPFTFVKCENCGSIKFEFIEQGYMFCETCSDKKDKTPCSWQHPELKEAVTLARLARFEHGETPTGRGGYE